MRKYVGKHRHNWYKYDSFMQTCDDHIWFTKSNRMVETFVQWPTTDPVLSYLHSLEKMFAGNGAMMETIYDYRKAHLAAWKRRGWNV